MNDTPSLHTYRLSGRNPEDLTLLDITVEPLPRSPLYTLREGCVWKTIGWVFVHTRNEKIVIKPYRGISTRELRYLYGDAEQAFLNPPSTATGWAKKNPDAEWWEGGVMIPATPDETAAALAAEVERFLETVPTSDFDPDGPIDLWPTDKAEEV